MTPDEADRKPQPPDAVSRISMPLGASDCDEWEWCEGTWRRFFLTKVWQVGQILVTVGGEQDQRGSVSRWLDVTGNAELSSAAALDLSRVLVEAAQLIDTLQTRAEDLGPPPWR